MFIITHKKELSIWLTDTPFKKKSGCWYFHDSLEDYEYDLEVFSKKYGKNFIITLDKIMKLYKERGEQEDDE